MEQKGNLYLAEQGKLFVRTKDVFVMGAYIQLGKNDSIDNYEERDFTEEEINAFNEKYGVIPRGRKVRK